MSISTMWEAKRSKRRSRLCGCMAGSSPVAASPATTRKSRGPALPIYSTSITKRLTMKGLMVLDWLDRQAEFEKEVGGYFKAGKREAQGNGRERNRQGGGRVPRSLPGAERRQDGGEVGLSPRLARAVGACAQCTMPGQHSCKLQRLYTPERSSKATPKRLN